MRNLKIIPISLCAAGMLALTGCASESGAEPPAEVLPADGSAPLSEAQPVRASIPAAQSEMGMILRLRIGL